MNVVCGGVWRSQSHELDERASEGHAVMCVVTVDAPAAVAGLGTDFAWKGSDSGSWNEKTGFELLASSDPYTPISQSAGIIDVHSLSQQLLINPYSVPGTEGMAKSRGEKRLPPSRRPPSVGGGKTVPKHASVSSDCWQWLLGSGEPPSPLPTALLLPTLMLPVALPGTPRGRSPCLAEFLPAQRLPDC
ncbi:hypothetical protein AAY473_025193 [Plecturocebus cupreus]